MRHLIFLPCCPLLVLLAGLPALTHAEAAATYQNLTLADAERLMLANSPALSLSRIAYEASSADVVTAGEAPNPQLSVNTSAINYRNGNGNGSLLDRQVDSVLRIDQPFERGNKRQLRVQAARAGQDAASADYADTLRALRLALTQAYFDLKYAQEIERVYADMLTLDQRSLDAAQARLNAGDMSRIDVARLEIEAAQTATQLVTAQAARTDAQAALAALLGTATQLDALNVVDDWPMPVTALAEPVTIEPMEIEQRPDVIAAQSRRQQADANVDLARSQQTHDITVGVQYEHYPQANGGNPNTVGVGISIPLFLRHRYEGEIQRALTDRATAEATLHQTKLAAGNEQQQARAALNGALNTLNTVQDTVLDKARQTTDAADFAYQRGAIALTDVLDAHRATLNIELDALDARLRYAKALAAWRAQTVATPVSIPAFSPAP